MIIYSHGSIERFIDVLSLEYPECIAAVLLVPKWCMEKKGYKNSYAVMWPDDVPDMTHPTIVIENSQLPVKIMKDIACGLASILVGRNNGNGEAWFEKFEEIYRLISEEELRYGEHFN